eukprot:gene2547-2918_t
MTGDHQTILLAIHEKLIKGERAPLDYSKNWKVTGNFFPKVDESTMPPKVIRFIEDCKDNLPVIFGLGSMPINDPETFYPMVVRVCKRLNRKTIILTGWTEFSGANDSADRDVIYLDQIDHGYLFQKSSCIVHHGGVGSTGAALRSGTPMVVIWFGFDQPYWGKRIEELNVGKSLKLLNLQEEDLYKALKLVLSNPSFKAKSIELARDMNKINGVQIAADIVEVELDKPKLERSTTSIFCKNTTI